MKKLRAVGLGIAALSILACSGKDCGRKAAKVIPALEKVNPEFGTEPVPCDDPFPTGSPRGCAIETLTCGDEIEGNTAQAGAYNFGDDFYQQRYCAPGRARYDDAPEAVYALEVPADVMADVMMTTDCGDLDIMAVAWADSKRCPTASHSTGECEMDPKSGSGSVRLATVGKAQTFLVVVDGKRGATGNFRLNVKCTTYR